MTVNVTVNGTNGTTDMVEDTVVAEQTYQLTVPSPSNGYYIYIESSFPRVEGDVACLDSPFVNVSQTPGFTFWHHILGDHVGALNVYAGPTNETLVQIFSTDESSGDRWKWTHVCLTDFNMTGEVFVRLEGVVGKDFMGDIAVDDVHFAECLVQPPPSPPPPPSPLPPPSPPPPSPPPCERPSEFVIIEDGGICDQTNPTIYGVCDPCGTDARGPLECVCVSSYVRRKRRGSHSHLSAASKRELLFGGVPGEEDFCYCQQVD
mmetsp:Transcript_7322/g.21510  ORF Transcript_7322/g.21510 Transcript_7322/m.21510 type:complete len:262 (+) Transcript_7322:32-817(+)